MVRGKFCTIHVTEYKDLIVTELDKKLFQQCLNRTYFNFHQRLFRERNFYEYPSLVPGSYLFNYENDILRIRKDLEDCNKEKVLKSSHTFRSIPNFKSNNFSIQYAIKERELKFNTILDLFFDSIKGQANNMYLKDWLAVYLFENKGKKDKPIIQVIGDGKGLLLNIIRLLQPNEFITLTDKGNITKGFTYYKSILYYGRNLDKMAEYWLDDTYNQFQYSNLITTVYDKETGMKIKDIPVICFNIDKKKLNDFYRLVNQLGFTITTFLESTLGNYSDYLYDHYLNLRIKS